MRISLIPPFREISLWRTNGYVKTYLSTNPSVIKVATWIAGSNQWLDAASVEPCSISFRAETLFILSLVPGDSFTSPPPGRDPSATSFRTWLARVADFCCTIATAAPCRGVSSCFVPETHKRDVFHGIISKSIRASGPSPWRNRAPDTTG